MPAPQRQQPVAVVSRLLQAPHGFAFFQALRLLERWLRQQGVPQADVLARRIAIRNHVSMSFPASEIAELAVEGELTVDEHGVPQSQAVEHIALTPAFIGLLGAGGALPRHYTDLFAERETFQRDRSGRAFLDIFLQRATVLFYQAWQKHRLPVQYEADRRNRYLPLMLSVAGIGLNGTRERLRAPEGGVADDTLAHYAGSLQRRPVAAATLQRILQRYFGVPVALQSFVGRWFTLPRDHQSHLGLQQMQLGRDMVMGERVWQRDLRVRLQFGPLARHQFLRLLPGAKGALALQELLQLLTGHTLEYEVRLTLRAQDVQGMALNEASPARLGLDSFLRTTPEREDRSDVGYDLLALA